MATSKFVKEVVNTCLRITKNDRVTIFTWRHMLDLAEALAIECRKAEAQVIVEVGSDEIFYGSLNLPNEYLSKTSPFSLALMDIATANIFIPGPENPDKLKEIPVEKWSAISKADKPYYERVLERKVRSAEISLGYVTPQRAKTYGFSYEAWKENVAAALDVNYKDMQKTGDKLRNVLQKTREVNVTTSKGTNLSFALADRPVHVYDGVIDDEDIKNGSIFAHLPSGSVAVAPMENSAKGRFVSDIPEPNAGVLVSDVEWGLEDGRLVSFEGGENVHMIKEQMKNASGDKDKIGCFQIGLNPRARAGFVYNSIVLGAVTMSIGDNREIGGENQSDWSSHFTIAKPTVKLDGRTIIKNGDLTL